MSRSGPKSGSCSQMSEMAIYQTVVAKEPEGASSPTRPSAAAMALFNTRRSALDELQVRRPIWRCKYLQLDEDRPPGDNPRCVWAYLHLFCAALSPISLPAFCLSVRPI
jgi:hypothetical protein